MALHQLNARDLIVEVSDGSTPATWTEVAGITSSSLNLAENEAVADTTTYASNGYYSEEVMQRGASLTLGGFVLIDPETGDRDPGQEAVEALGAAVGYDSRGQIRFRMLSASTDWTIWDCTVSLGEQSGETNAKRTWNATFRRCGQPTTEAVA